MTRLLSEMLGSPRTTLTFQINEFEKISGKPGLDIRLSGELKDLYGQKAEALGLDKHDTNAKELYFAMKSQVLKNSDKLSALIGVSDTDKPEEAVKKSIAFVEKRLGKKTVWGLKPSVARKQLKDNSPKRLMKILGLRSIDSALKRESLPLLYCFARLLEPPVWHNKYASQSLKLSNSDFDNLSLSIKIVPDKQHERLEKHLDLGQIVYSDQETAGMEICVPSERFSGDVIFLVDTLLVHIRHMLRISEYYKFQALKPDFFKKLERLRLSGFHNLELEGLPVDWHTLAHAAAEKGVTDFLQTDDSFYTPENLLAPLLHEIAGFDFWSHPFAMYSDSGAVISFNLSDMIINTVNDNPPEKAYVGHGRTQLRKELFSRYLEHEALKEKINNLNMAGV